MGRKRLQRKIIKILKRFGIKPFTRRVDLSYLIMYEMGMRLSLDRRYKVLGEFYDAKLAPCGCCWEYSLSEKYRPLIEAVFRELGVSQ